MAVPVAGFFGSAVGSLRCRYTTRRCPASLLAPQHHLRAKRYHLRAALRRLALLPPRLSCAPCTRFLSPPRISRRLAIAGYTTHCAFDLRSGAFPVCRMDRIWFVDGRWFPFSSGWLNIGYYCSVLDGLVTLRSARASVLRHAWFFWRVFCSPWFSFSAAAAKLPVVYADHCLVWFLSPITLRFWRLLPTPWFFDVQFLLVLLPWFSLRFLRMVRG
jgi:hypothetical protein